MNFVLSIIFCLTCALLQADELRLLSYNVRIDHEQDADNENRWVLRAPHVVKVIQSHAPDLLALQEPNEAQVADLKKALGNRYGWIHGPACDKAYREPEKYLSEQHRETQAIAYDQKRFELLDSGRFWLAPDPTKEPETAPWDSSPFLRVAVYVTLYDRIQQQKITLITSHFDHKGLQTRLESVDLVVKKALELAGDHPFFITGDFNTFQNDGGPLVYEAFLKYRDLMQDVRDVASKQEGPLSTWVGWDYNAFNEKAMEKLCPGVPSRWDHVFVSGVTVKRTAVDDSRFKIVWKGMTKEVYPSDHRPIIVDFSISNPALQ